MENNTVEEEISLKEIFFLLLSRIKLILLITLLFTLGAFCVAKFVLPLEYTSNVKIYVKNNSTSSDTSGVTYSDLNAAKILVETYIVILDDNVVYENVSDRLIEDYDIEDLNDYFVIEENDEGEQYISSEQIKSLVSFTSVNETEVLKVSCTSRVPEFSAAICTYISEYAPQHFKRVTETGLVETVSEPQVPTSPSGPNIPKITIAGGLVGLVLAIVLVIVLSSFDNEVTGGEEIKQKFNVPVLAEIPDIFMDEKGGGKYARYSK